MNITKYEWNLSCGGMDEDSHGDYYRCNDIDPLLEELETLRAEHESIKENLTIAYMDGYAKAQEKIRVLEAENAKLIAWCDRMQNNIEGNEEHIKSLEEAFDKIEKYNWQLIAERDEMKKWHDAVLHECMMTESCYVESDPLMSVKNLVGWHVEAEREAMMKQTHKRADELLVGDHIKKFGEVVKIFQITSNGGYIKINFEEAHLPPEAIIEMAYDPLPAQQIPEGYTAEDSLNKYVESIGGYDSNAWHDHSVLDLYIKGFEAGRLSGMPVEPDSNIINSIKSVKIECGFNGHDEAFYTNASTYEAKKIYSAMLSASQPKGDE